VAGLQHVTRLALALGCSSDARRAEYEARPRGDPARLPSREGGDQARGTDPLRVFTGAIHIYGGDFFGMPRSEWDPETLEERPWDVARTCKAFADATERWLAEAARARSQEDPRVLGG